MHLHDPETHPLGKLLKNYVSLDFLGQPIPKETAQLIATGQIDPMSRKQLLSIDKNDHVYSRKQQVTAPLPGVSSLIQTKTTDGFIKPRSKEEVKIIPTGHSQGEDSPVKELSKP